MLFPEARADLTAQNPFLCDIPITLLECNSGGVLLKVY
jgi:hypothetical protein